MSKMYNHAKYCFSNSEDIDIVLVVLSRLYIPWLLKSMAHVLIVITNSIVYIRSKQNIGLCLNQPWNIVYDK